MRGSQLVLTALIAIPVIAPSPISADDWPQWRGPERDGISRESGLLDEWPDGGPAIKWQVDGVGEGYGSVAVADGLVYVQGGIDGRSILAARSVEDGRVVWSHDFGPRLVQDKGNGPRSTPTVQGGAVYAANGMGELARLDAKTGEVAWQFNVIELGEVRNPGWGYSESPLVSSDSSGDRIYVMPGGDKGAIVALDAADGSVIWKSSELTDRTSYSSLVEAEFDGVQALVGFTQRAGVGVRKSDGKLLWRYEAPANRTANAATPVVLDDLVFYTSSYGVGGGAVRITTNGDEATAEEAYFVSNLQNHHGGVVLYDGHIYGFFGPALGCADARTGEILWRARSVGKGSVSIADGKLFLLGENHRVGLALASPEGYQELGRFDIEDLDWPSWNLIVVSDGLMYLRNQGSLTAFDVRAN